MDWTGGTRRRFAPRGKQSETVQKQKAHFARARAAAEPRHPDSPDHSQFAEASRQYQPPMSSQEYRSADSKHVHSRRPKSRPGRVTSDRSSRGRSQPRPSKHAREEDLRPTYPRQQPLGEMTEEEQLLYANRERLLARADWLGLSASRPARHRFPSSRDKDLVGKRRKVHKFRTSKPKLREPTFHPPLFGEKLTYPEPMMSGAIPQESLNIRIGTDAFATQTQPSQHTRTPVNTSLRHPSTDFGPLSEEPMVVGVDEHGFERPALGNVRPDEFNQFRQHLISSANETDNYTAIQGALPSVTARSTTYTNADCLPSEESFEDLDAGSSPLRSRRGSPRNAQYDDPRNVVAAVNSPSTLHTHTGEHRGNIRPDEHQVRMLPQVQRAESPDFINQCPLRSESEIYSLHATRATTDDLPSQSFWRHAIAGAERQASFESNVALAPPDGPHQPAQVTVHTQTRYISTLKPTTIQSMNTTYPEKADAKNSSLASLDADGHHAEEARDNEIWRNFVIGSQSSENELAQPTRRSVVDLWQGTEPVAAAYSTSSNNLDLARSDKATAGYSVYTGQISDRDSQQVMIDSSMIAQATTVHPDSGGLEPRVQMHDVDDVRSFTTGNINASSVTTRKQRKTRTNKSRRPTRSAQWESTYVPTTARRRTHGQPKSVYDFPDSD